MHRILHNRYYMGVVTYGGVEYPGEHEALMERISVDRFIYRGLPRCRRRRAAM